MPPGPDTPPGPIEPPGPVEPPGPIEPPGPDKPPGPIEPPGPTPRKPDVDNSSEGYTTISLTTELEIVECRMCAALVRNLRGPRNLHSATHQQDRLQRLGRW